MRDASETLLGGVEDALQQVWSLAENYSKRMCQGQGSSACLVWDWEWPCLGSQERRTSLQEQLPKTECTLGATSFCRQEQSRKSGLIFLPQELLTYLHLYPTTSLLSPPPPQTTQGLAPVILSFLPGIFLSPTYWMIHMNLPMCYSNSTLNIKILIWSSSPLQLSWGFSASLLPFCTHFYFTANYLKESCLYSMVLLPLLSFSPEGIPGRLLSSSSVLPFVMATHNLLLTQWPCTWPPDGPLICPPFSTAVLSLSGFYLISWSLLFNLICRFHFFLSASLYCGTQGSVLGHSLF